MMTLRRGWTGPASAAAVFILAIAFQLLFTTSPADAAGTARVAGHVAQEDGAALAGVWVDLYSKVDGDWVYTDSTDTDSAGDYAFELLEAGDWAVGFGFEDWPEAPGAWTEQYWNGRDTLEAADPITLADGQQATADAVLTTPQASLTGVITNSAGVPVTDGWVTLYAPDGSGGWTGIDLAFTDIAGRYSFYDLASGSYRVGCQSTWTTWYNPVYVTRFYGGTAAVESATSVTVQADAVSHADFAMLGGTGLTLNWRYRRAGADDWKAGPAYAELKSNSGDPLVAGTTFFTVNGAAEALYADWVPLPDGVTVFAYRTRNPDGLMSYQPSSSIKTDSTPPAAPRAWLSSVSMNSATLGWESATDGAGSGVVSYVVEHMPTNFRRNPAGLSLAIPRIGEVAQAPIPYVTVRACDKVGFESQGTTVTIPWPDTYAEGTVAPGATTGLVLGADTIRVGTTGISQPVSAWLARLPQPPADAPNGFRQLGTTVSPGVSGSLGAGALALTVPYASAISPERAANVLVGQWIGGVWVLSKPSRIDTAARTVTFYSYSLAPFSLFESNQNGKLAISAWFKGLSADKTTLAGGMQDVVSIRGRVKDSSGLPVGGLTLVAQRRAYNQAEWTDFKTVTTSSSGELTFKSARDMHRTYYRLVYRGSASFAASESRQVSLYPEFAVFERFPSPVKRVKRTYTVEVRPARKAGAASVSLHFYRYERGRWKKYGSVKTKMASTASYRTVYKASHKLSKRGKWKVKAYVPADGVHSATWSQGSLVYVR